MARRENALAGLLDAAKAQAQSSEPADEPLVVAEAPQEPPAPRAQPRRAASAPLPPAEPAAILPAAVRLRDLAETRNRNVSGRIVRAADQAEETTMWSFRIPTHMHRAIKASCVESGVTMQEAGVMAAEIVLGILNGENVGL